MRKLASVISVICLVAVLSCDNPVNESEPVAGISPPQQGPTIVMLAPYNSSTVISLHRIFPGFRSLKINDPNNRTTYFDNRYLRYKSEGQEDSFEITVTDPSNVEIRSLVVFQPISDALACADRVPFERASISGNQVLVVNLLNNPEFCEYDSVLGEGEVGVAGPEPGVDSSCGLPGGLFLEVCECGSFGDHIILTYVPPSGGINIGQRTCKYYAHAEGDPNVGYPDRFYDPSYSNFFSAYQFTIDIN